ncbi:MAG TPA: GNAT family N-acetyltransferase [Pseudacidobacterium sp.]|jgi:GNAT superfamily N-acetyltransferase|nr:GNAT family N-acetyltransferase [Pseudacidobacterium sp.]
MASIHIRTAIHDEIPALQNLIERSVRELQAGWYSPGQIEAAVHSVFGVDTQLIDDGTYYVAEIDGQMAGCGGWSKRGTLYGASHFDHSRNDVMLDPAQEPARIRAFFTHPEFARRGIGKALLKHCEKAAVAAGFQSMEMAATLPGVPLYQINGYEVLGSFRVPLPEGQSIEVKRMAKRITNPK